MKRTETPAPASPKAGRKSVKLTLASDTALAFEQVMSRIRAEDTASLSEEQTNDPRRERYYSRQLPRWIGNQLLCAACEALLDKGDSITKGIAYLKLERTEMSAEEVAAIGAMRAAEREADNGTLEQIDDATEAAAIRKLEVGN